MKRKAPEKRRATKHASEHSVKGHAKHKKTSAPRKHRLHRPPAITSTPAGSAGPILTEQMVERLFWRAGFGPTAQERSTWTGSPVSSAVEWLLSTPAGSSGVAGTDDGAAFDPTGNDVDLVLAWVDGMIRSTNPFVERLTFFWHRHWANSRESVSPPQLMITQNELFRAYSDFAAAPTATFRELAYQVTIDPSMLQYLTGDSNVKGAPNENYARELMELFTLGVTNAAGQANYSQTDVEQIAKALSGWQINDTNPDAVKAYFDQAQWYDGPKLIFGQFGNFDYTDVINLVTAHPAHPAFIINELWNEFIVPPLDAATLQSLITTYTTSGFQLKPLLKQILTNPALFDSIDEPDMIKPPVVYVVGAMRALGVGIVDTTANDYLDAMGELPYFPPNVSGWEGGLSWLNTDTALARFGFVSALLSTIDFVDIPGETAAAAYLRAYVATGQPWMAAGTEGAIQNFAATVASSTVEKRKERQIALQALMLAGPDSQVM